MKKNTVSKTRNVNTHGEMRFASLLKIVKAVQNSTKSKNDIKKETGLSWGSCSEIITLLEDKKILVPDKNDVSTGKQGRKATHFTFNNKKHLLFGMEIRPFEINCSIINWGKTELFHKSYIQNEEIDGKNIFKIISNAYINALVDFGLKSDQIMGLSLSLIGGVDSANYKWTFSSRIKNVHHLDLKPLLSTLPSLRFLHLEHDINAQASSVVKSKSLEKESNYAFVHIGEGVGLSLYNNGIYMGARGFAGEIGHIPYPNAERHIQCLCGKEDCAETILSTHGVLEYINAEFKQKFKTISEIDNAFLTDKKVIERITNTLVYLLITVTNILDPQILIIGGEALEPFKNIQPEVEKELRARSWLNGPVQIKWFRNEEMNCAYGSILNTSDEMIEKFIKSQLL